MHAHCPPSARHPRQVGTYICGRLSAADWAARFPDYESWEAIRLEQLAHHPGDWGAALGQAAPKSWYHDWGGSDGSADSGETSSQTSPVEQSALAAESAVENHLARRAEWQQRKQMRKQPRKRQPRQLQAPPVPNGDRGGKGRGVEPGAA